MNRQLILFLSATLAVAVIVAVSGFPRRHLPALPPGPLHHLVDQAGNHPPVHP